MQYCFLFCFMYQDVPPQLYILHWYISAHFWVLHYKSCWKQRSSWKLSQFYSHLSAGHCLSCGGRDFYYDFISFRKSGEMIKQSLFWITADTANSKSCQKTLALNVLLGPKGVCLSGSSSKINDPWSPDTVDGEGWWFCKDCVVIESWRTVHCKTVLWA